MTAYASRAPLPDFTNESSINNMSAYQKTSPDDKDMLNVLTIKGKLTDWHSGIHSVKDADPVDVKPNSSHAFYVEANPGEAENYNYTKIDRFLTTFTPIPIEHGYRIEAMNMFRALNEINQRLAQRRAINESLDNALNELAELDDYAAESELTPPVPAAKKFAREILGILTSRAPRHYSVSLWEDGDVVIYSGNTEWRVSVYCRADGGAAFYVSSPNNHDHDSEYQLAQDMPVDPIIDTLNKIPA